MARFLIDTLRNSGLHNGIFFAKIMNVENNFYDMDNLSEIIKRRSTPGILIFDMNNRLLYSNETALRIIPDLKNIPEEIYDLCKEKIRNINKIAGTQETIYSVLNTDSGISHSMRAIVITGFGESKSIPHIMVLIEGIIDKHRINFEKVKQMFNLTRRELEVLNLICVRMCK